MNTKCLLTPFINIEGHRVLNILKRISEPSILGDGKCSILDIKDQHENQVLSRIVLLL